MLLPFRGLTSITDTETQYTIDDEPLAAGYRSGQVSLRGLGVTTTQHGTTVG